MTDRWIPEEARLQLFATDAHGCRKAITDLYWFEEEGVHDWSGEGHCQRYALEVFLDGALIFSGALSALKGEDSGPYTTRR